MHVCVHVHMHMKTLNVFYHSPPDFFEVGSLDEPGSLAKMFLASLTANKPQQSRLCLHSVLGYMCVQNHIQLTLWVLGSEL